MTNAQRALDIGLDAVRRALAKPKRLLTDAQLRDCEPHLYECSTCLGSGRLNDTEHGRSMVRACLDCRGTGIDEAKRADLSSEIEEAFGVRGTAAPHQTNRLIRAVIETPRGDATR